MPNEQKTSYPKDWSIDDEQAFLKWYGNWARQTGINPDPNNRSHYYDYRQAYLDDVGPNWDQSQGSFKWPSAYKTEDHPQRFTKSQDGHVLDTITNKPAQQEAYEKWKQDRAKAMGDAFKNSSNWSK